MKRQYFWLSMALLPVILYVFILRDYVQMTYEGNAPSWFNALVQAIYPRFEVEKHRFDMAFFLHKADQIFIRYVLVLAFLFLLNTWQKTRNFNARFIPVYPDGHYRILTLLFYTGLLLYTWDWLLDFPDIITLSPFYKPVLLFRVLGIPIPHLWVFEVLYWIYVAALILSMWHVYPVWSSSLAALLLVYFQGFFMSFEKIDHGYTTLTYAAMLMPFLLYETSQHRQKQYLQHPLASWSLFFIRFTLAATYFLSGLEKLLTSGWKWAGKDTFQTYLSLHPTPWGDYVKEHALLSAVLPVFTLLFQLGFILILWFPRWKWIFLSAGILFHLGTKLMMDIGGWVSPWVFVYLFFINWNFLNKLPLIRSITGWQPVRLKYNKNGK